jgi:hypothetical protein
VGEILHENTREQDVVARYGGEEFALLLHSTSTSSSLRLAERLRLRIEAHPWLRRAVTASLGTPRPYRPSPIRLALWRPPTRRSTTRNGPAGTLSVTTLILRCKPSGSAVPRPSPLSTLPEGRLRSRTRPPHPAAQEQWPSR